MTKRDCEAIFGLIEETLRNVPNTGAEHAKRVAKTARELLGAERERLDNPRVKLEFNPNWPADLDEHDDEVEFKLLERLDRDGLLTRSPVEAREILSGTLSLPERSAHELRPSA